MAPKHANPRASSPSLQKKRSLGYPASIVDKIAKAQGPQAPSDTIPDRPRTRRKQNPAILPPPSEYAALIEADAAAKNKKKPKKLLTTKEKIAAAEAAARAKSLTKAKPCASPKTTKKVAKKNPVKEKAKLPGMLSQLNSHCASAIKYAQAKKSVKVSVLERRTLRSEKYLKQHPEEKGMAVPVCGKPGKGPGLMDLPPEVRDMIWKLAVVESEYFIWIDSPIGREQPDLAMVSTEVRGEVLPIFYGENVFAIDLSPFEALRAKKDGKVAVTGPVALEKWAEALAVKGTSGYIRKLAFDYVPPNLKKMFLNHLGAVVCTEQDRSFVVYLELKRPKQKRKSWAVEKLEVHRDARCVLAKQLSCVVTQTPAWLNDAVYPILELPGYPVIKPVNVVRLARTVKERVGELVAHRCEETLVLPSVETKSFDNGA